MADMELPLTDYVRGVEDMRLAVCKWLRQCANEEATMRAGGAKWHAFIEAHNEVLLMDLPGRKG